MSKNKKTEPPLHSMDSSNCAEGVYSASGRVVASEFQSDSRTACVSEIVCMLDKEVENGFKDEAAKFLCGKLESSFSETIKKIDAILKASSGWIKMTDDFWYFDPICALLPAENTLNFSTHGSYDSWPSVLVPSFIIGKKYKACLIRDDELKSVMDSKNCPYPWDGDKHKYFCAVSNGGISPFSQTSLFKMGGDAQVLLHVQFIQNYQGKISEKTTLGCHYKGGSDRPTIINGTFLPVFRLTDGPAIKIQEMPVAYRLVLWALFQLTPEYFQNDPDFAKVCNYIRENPECIDPKSENILNKDNVTARFRSNEDMIKATVAHLQDKYPPFEKILRENAIIRLLRCDEIRANIKPEYDHRTLTDPNSGHWDLWAENADELPDEQTTIRVPCEYYARNPKVDIQQGGVVGIDFGTKSTIVVRLIAKEKPKPMRIGRSDFREIPKDTSDYENPTVMQFIDITSFFDAYEKRKGRPLTKWSDLTISHTAADMLRESTDSDLFPSFLSELKQWAGGNRELKIKDRRGKVLTLPPYGKLADGEIDPIEFYAYYIGLNINHMQNGIFLRYEISYPVTYDKDILMRLRKSFERGIRKSLPDSILNDAELMKLFRVRFGASEPAAYSLCALKEYGFDPSGDDKIFYGVFDFGGGTTDFDFGTFREATEEEQDAGKDYVLEHFRPSGDKYLGGENILQLIAFEVFKKNKEMLLKQNIQFPIPFECENTSFEGEEGLIDKKDSSAAHLNMKLVMEKLRPLWESSKAIPAEEASESQSAGELDSGTLKVTLFDRTGEQQANISLVFDRDELEKRIRDRIRSGVAQFFQALHETFKEPYVPRDLNKINLFLAGNSCRSPLVKELFEEFIEAFVKDNADFKNVFELFPPLGSEEAIQKMKERNPDKTIYTGVECPTGKTGVAFGLVMGREGSNYLVIDKNMDSEGRIAFRYYVGKSRKGNFNPVLSKASERGRWERVMSVADSSMVELRYSDLDAASTGELPEEKTTLINISVNQPEDKDKSLFIRVKNANEFEYAFAKEEAAIMENLIKSYRLE